MNEFDEEKISEETSAENQPENGAQQTANSAPTEENPTYHYVYKKPEEQPKAEYTANNNFNNYAQNNGGYAQNGNYAGNNNYNPYTNPASSYYSQPASNTQQSAVTAEDKPKKGKNKVIIGIVIALVICLVAAIAGIASSVGNKDISEPDTAPNSNAQVETKDQEDVAMTDKNGNYTVAGIAEKCIDSCVGITVYTEASNYSNFYGYGFDRNNSAPSGEEVKSGEGSGILMLEDNGRTYILTCAHVISDGTSFTVTTNDGKEHNARMVAFDAQTDIGVLVMNETGFQIAEFANSASTVLGEQVVAIGCPGGLEFMNSVTSGYVSALARPISSTIGYNTDCIQIDAAINPGNSGGALFNMQGQVIGVNSSKIAATEYEGIGFAVPSNTAVATANSLIKSGYVEGRAKLGITYKNIETYQNANSILDALDKLGFKDANGTMVINEINDNSDLKNKDIREYDMIVAVNGNTMTSTDVITSLLSNSKPGDTITLTIARIENNKIDAFNIECKLIESKG